MRDQSLFGITRVRNEGLIIADTIKHFLNYCDHIILYDDCSDDDTAEIAMRAGQHRINIIHNLEWRHDRLVEETRHRKALVQDALLLGAEWCLCFDADERLVGELPPLQGPGYKFRLFDGYLTPERPAPYSSGKLVDLARMWGPEYRDILMLFPTDTAKFVGLDRREPFISGVPKQAKVLVKHFGKCLSIDHWEETCDYYATHFPEPYRSKWHARRGKAIHTVSDFGRPLQTWTQLMRNPTSWVKI